jgi:hypothetical protein
MTVLHTLAIHPLRGDACQMIAVRKTYSRMKHGIRSATRVFARTLADALLDTHPQFMRAADPPLFLAAYKAVPPACHFLSLYCLERINLCRVAEDREPGRLIQIHKDKVVAGNYALSTLEKRQAELEDIVFSLEGRNLRDRVVILLDDARITGAAERRILEVVRPEAPRALILGYVLRFDEDRGNDDPAIENILNHTAIREIGDLLPAIHVDDFDLNIRTLKLILSAPEETLTHFLETIPAGLCAAIVRGATDTGVDFVQHHAQAYALARAIHERRES